MIEQAIYFVLGCVVTALAALAFAPLFWRRALRLTRARLRLQVPLSMQEILAERDQLRAEFAVARLKLEQQMERIRAGKTHDMATIGRQRVAAAAAADEIAGLRRLEQSQDREIRLLTQDIAAVEAEAGALRVEVYDAHSVVERWRAQADRDAGARGALRGEVDAKRTLTAALESRVAGLEARLQDSQHAGEARENSLRGRLESAMAQSARHETSGVSLRHDLDEARQRIRALEHELAMSREREKDSNLAQSLQSGKARGLDRAATKTIEELRGENAALRDALAELRRSGSEDGGDGSLRASIHALGLAVARMTWTPPDAGASERERSRQTQPSPIDAA